MYGRISKQFDPLYDGSLSLANLIIKIVQESNYFTLKDYPSKDEFYEKFIERYLDFRHEVSENSEPGSNIDIINTALLSVLYRLEDQSELTLFIFLRFYCQILTLVSMVRDIDYHITTYQNHGYIFPNDKNILDLLFYDPDSDKFANINNVEEETEYILNKISEHMAEQEPLLVPFISNSGLYGLNSFLILYINGISPVGITNEMSIAHGGAFLDSLLEPIEHDLQHNQINLDSNMVYYRLGYLDSKKITAREYYEKIIQIHDEDLRKDCIYVLFDYIHEKDTDPDCDGTTFDKPHPVYNTNPEFFMHHRLNDTNSDDEEYVVQYVWRKMVSNFCYYVRDKRVNLKMWLLEDRDYLDQMQYI